MRRFRPYVFSIVLALASFPLWAAGAEGEEAVAEKFLGLPVELWKTINLFLILGLFVYLLKKPIRAHFGARRSGVDEELDRAKKERDEAVKLTLQMKARLATLETEVASIRQRGSADGEIERRAQIEAAEKEAEQLRRGAADEIERRLSAAKQELARAAADLAVSKAKELVAEAVTEEDRRRLFDESVQKISRIQ
jgi:F-type H+-transporting ATPase subunit b